MYITLAVALISALIIFLVVINVIQQYKERSQNLKKMELSKMKRQIDEVEQVLSAISGLPISNNTIMILYGRLEDGLAKSKTISESNIYDQKLNNIKTQMTNMKNRPPKTIDIESFQVPKDEKSLMNLVQLLKNIKTILQSESQLGRIAHQIHSSESQKISHFQLRLNIENTLGRVKAMLEQQRYNTAKQMLAKVSLTLDSLELKMPDDNYIQEKKSQVASMKSSITESAPPPKATQEDDRTYDNQEDDNVFGSKKKW
jgi:hypothetical protein